MSGSSVRPWRGRAILFDLFGTVVQFAPQVPTLHIAGTRWRSTMGWLRDTVARVLPEIAFDDMLTSLTTVTQEIVRARPPEYLEVPSRERFRRALLRLGVDQSAAPALAEELSVAHMGHLAATTMMPPADLAALRRLRVAYRLALISNFDHAPTARHILATHGLEDLFDPIVISDEFGRRKPHPAIFAATLARLGIANDEALFVGDSVDDDLIGAANARVRAIWINAGGEPLPVGVAEPFSIVRNIAEISEQLVGEPN